MTNSPGSRPNATTTSAVDSLAGVVLIVAPHMDDEVLACGGLIALLPSKQRIHMAFATDGMKSPAPIFPWRDSITPDLGERRRNESRAAAAMLGVPTENLRFLDLPEGELGKHEEDLARGLREVIATVAPDHILFPFRYDRHPDHIAVNHAVMAARRDGCTSARLTEYFVYYRWRLLPRRDVRRYVRPESLMSVDIGDVAAVKRTALDCFTTQTTRYYDWQTRPILRPELLDEECAGPELLLRTDDAPPGPRVFSSTATWIRIAHRLEPRLLRWKYLMKSTWARVAGGDV